jgi:hypothetical protein
MNARVRGEKRKDMTPVSVTEKMRDEKESWMLMKRGEKERKTQMMKE